jgi:hypothetical protein
MSWQATAWAERQKTGSPARKVLLLVLANYADANGLCWPSQATLAEGTEQSIDTVQRQLRKLEADGHIQREKRVRAGGLWPGHTYRLNMSTEPQSAARSEPPPGRNEHGHRAAMSTVTGPQALRHEPSKNNQREKPIPPSPPDRVADTAGTTEKEDRPIVPSFDGVFMASGAAGPRGPALAQWNKLSVEDRLAVGSFANVAGIDTGGAWFSTWLKARGWEESAPPVVGFTDPKLLEDCARSMEQLRRMQAADVIGKADSRWRPIARKLQEQIGGDQLASWFASVTLRSITSREIIVEAPSVFIRCEVEKRYRDALVRAARAADPDCTVTQARVVLAEPLTEAAQ